jgi:cbb3-type cytochrome oxidase subunit 1
VRLCGGLLVIGGMGLMAYNYWKTVQQVKGAVQPVAVPQPA